MVLDLSNLGAAAILTLDAVLPNTCLPSDDVLCGVLKSLPPFSKLTLGFSGNLVVVACNLPTNLLGLSYAVVLDPPVVLDDDRNVIVIVDIFVLPILFYIRDLKVEMMVKWKMSTSL